MATPTKPRSDQKRPPGRPRAIVVSSPEPGVEYETVHLTRAHGLNDMTYGPGPVRVRRDIARTLLENEQRVAQAAKRMFEPRTRVITGNGRLVTVPQDYFDDPSAWTRMPVVGPNGRVS